MYSLDEIKNAIRALPIGENNIKLVIDKNEIKELPNIIQDSEAIMDIVGGFYDSGSGILVATDRRLIFVYKGLMWGMKVEDFPYDKISSIQYETGMLTGELIIFASGNKANIKAVAKERCKGFCEHVRVLISYAAKSKNVEPQPASQENDMISQLEKLAKLKEMGALTDEEFASAKKKLLD